jgi:dual specificity MAP kinase phosphatase
VSLCRTMASMWRTDQLPSVLIQPNLRLLYNLCSWEVELAREHPNEERQKTFLSRRLAWPFLAREVHCLNEKYIQ